MLKLFIYRFTRLVQIHLLLCHMDYCDNNNSKSVKVLFWSRMFIDLYQTLSRVLNLKKGGCGVTVFCLHGDVIDK